MDAVQALRAVVEGRYDLLALLGEGGFGTVYKARQLATGQLVAIKVLRLPHGNAQRGDEKRVARFRREMQLCAQLHHPNIVRILDSGHTNGGVLYSVFELVPGKNLGELLATEGHVNAVETRHLLTQVLDALSCAHAQGVVHRDLKPANIMITPTGARRNALVLDFGIGTIVDDVLGQDVAKLTLSNESIGTPAYAAPEQLRGMPPTPRSDLYSWALVFIECLTGERVVRGETVAEVVWKQLSPDPISIPSVLANHPLGGLLRRATVKDPEQRDVSAESLLRALETCDVSALRPRFKPASLVPVAPDAATATVAALRGRDRGRHLVEAERRQITAVCCNLTLFGTGANSVDTEELDQLLSVEQDACTEIARIEGGHLAGALGDSVVFYFGFPSAHEDDARRASRAALAMVAEGSRRSVALEHDRGTHVRLRIGIHTGLVVAREPGDPASSSSSHVVGTTPKLATRLASLADPFSVLVSGATERIVRNQFALQLSSIQLADDATSPVEVFVLCAASPATPHVDSADR